ncbi:hypothetical protein BMS3Abin03_02347 [bacterium BMS3Abin03]|nr:hypothetical protein BMS3Abin03_02347 [bacterium BMS3Abin03]
MKLFNLIVAFTIFLSFSLTAQTPTLNINKTDGTTDSYSLSSIQSITFGSSNIIVTEGLVSYYPFNGNANDVWGTNNGTFMNGTTVSTDRKGNANSACLLDGVDDYVALTTYLPETDEISISVWVYYTKPGNQIADIIVDTDQPVAPAFRLDMHNTGIGITANKNGATLNKSNGTAVMGLNLENGWHHIVWAMASDQSLIYLDGTLVGTIVKTGSNVGDHADHAVIGAYYDGNPPFKNFFNGKIDDLRIYNRLLTPEEVSLLYNE